MNDVPENPYRTAPDNRPELDLPECHCCHFKAIEFYRDRKSKKIIGCDLCVEAFTADEE